MSLTPSSVTGSRFIGKVTLHRSRKTDSLRAAKYVFNKVDYPGGPFNFPRARVPKMHPANGTCRFRADNLFN